MGRRLVRILSAASVLAVLGFPARGLSTVPIWDNPPMSDSRTVIHQTGAPVMGDGRISEGQAEWIVGTWKPAEAGAKSASSHTEFPWIKSNMSPLWTAMGICLLAVAVMTWLDSRKK